MSHRVFPIPLIEPDNFEQIIARGVKCIVDGKQILIGNKALLFEHGIAVANQAVHDANTPIFVAINAKLSGIIFISDTIRSNA